MKTKIFKTKSVIALALVLFMVVPMLFAALPGVKAQTTPVLSVVPDGQPGATMTTMIAGLAVGSTFTVDIRVDDIGDISQGINGLSYSITYNAAVLQLTGHATKNASFWGANVGDVTSIVTTSSGVFTESAIIVPSGAPDESTNTPGVATTLTFKVLTTGQSDINFQPSDVGVAYLTYPDAVGNSHDVTANVENAIYNQLTTSISAYQHGTANSVIQFAPNTDPIGSTFTVDVNITNQLAEPIWGYNVGVNWNPAVLQLETVTEGTYLNSAPGLYDGSSTLFIAGSIDNVHGDIPQGVSDVYLTNETTTSLSGTLFNLTFEVINYANSSINLTPGNPTLIDNLGNSQSVTLNSAQYVTLAPPAPTSPVAVISPPASTMYLAGAPLSLTGINSQPGVDYIPNAQSPIFPITTYTWTVPAGITITGQGTATINFTGPTPAADITIGLTVSTATNPSDLSYVNVSNETTIILSPAFTNPTTAGAQIDVYVVAPFPYAGFAPISQGIFNNTNPAASLVDTYAPQQLMSLEAYVGYNGATVADKLVTFYVTAYNNPSDVIATFVGYTNDNGIIDTSYRLPNYNSSVMPFGEYTVTATVDVAQVQVTDCFSFEYNYILNFASVTTPAETARGQAATSQITIANNAFTTQPYYLTYTVTDNNNVPILSGSANGTATIVATPINAQGINTAFTITLNLPSYAFVGTATLHVDLFNANPATQNGLPYCPENDQTFTIAIPAA